MNKILCLFIFRFKRVRNELMLEELIEFDFIEENLSMALKIIQMTDKYP